MSIRPEHFQKILSGEKTIELRRRRMHISAGTIVWLYETTPKGRLGARARISQIVEGTPKEVWKLFQHRVGLSKERFFEYFEGAAYACALLLEGVVPLGNPLHLFSLRKSLGSFVAPQFYKRLQDSGREVHLFKGLLAAP